MERFWVALVAILLLFVFVGKPMIFYSSRMAVGNVHVIKTERVNDGKTSKYLVFTDHETFQDTDTIWALKYNSSDIYGKINKGDTCTFVVAGWRFPFLSWYRNILSADCHA